MPGSAVTHALPGIPAPAALWRSMRIWMWAVCALLLADAVPDLIVDYWFFESVGRGDVFGSNLSAQLALFVVTPVVLALGEYLPSRQAEVSRAVRTAAR